MHIKTKCNITLLPFVSCFVLIDVLLILPNFPKRSFTSASEIPWNKPPIYSRCNISLRKCNSTQTVKHTFQPKLYALIKCVFNNYTTIIQIIILILIIILKCYDHSLQFSKYFRPKQDVQRTEATSVTVNVTIIISNANPSRNIRGKPLIIIL